MELAALFLLCFLFDGYYFPALIMATFWANGMRQTHFTTVAALHKIHCLQAVMRPSAISSSLGYFSFWLRNHINLLLRIQQNGVIILLISGSVKPE